MCREQILKLISFEFCFSKFKNGINGWMNLVYISMLFNYVTSMKICRVLELNQLYSSDKKEKKNKRKKIHTHTAFPLQKKRQNFQYGTETKQKQKIHNNINRQN